MNRKALNFDPATLKYSGVIGTGGIGSGRFFMLNGDHTLGREESRSGHFLDISDYCKQHIILHYVKVFLGDEFIVIPVGKVGDDDIGDILYRDMEATGFVMKHVERVPKASTLFSFCFYYPDGTGGNLTTDNSASSQVDSGYISRSEEDIAGLGSRGIVMAAPEVPVEARNELLRTGKKHGLFCTASFTSEEIVKASEDGMLAFVDLLAINMDEASKISDKYHFGVNSLTAEKAVRKLSGINGSMKISITAGKEGSWCWDGRNLKHFPSARAKAVSTAGAGDAFFAGLIAGHAQGLTLFESQELATIIAALSVISPDTINKGADRSSLREFVKSANLDLSPKIITLLED